MKTPKNDNEIKALELFEQALKRSIEDRQAFIINETGENTALREQVEKLLHLDAQNSSEMLTGQAVIHAPEEDLTNAEIGSYRIIELIGKGGMGAVYKAERKTGDFTHSVAIKVIRLGVLSEALVERFERERQTLADFSHPHIARLFDGGTTEDGAPYIIMEYIDGAAITDFADNKQLDKTDRLKLFQNACAAISYAHQNLIIHRDITPNNVLVTQDGDVKLIDFGISKTLEESLITHPSENSLGSLSFTPGFAAPERSKGAAANTLSDIYSLGKLLEALLPDNTQSNDLQAIIAKAAHLNPQNRYASVDTLIEDINNYNEGFPISAIPSTSRYKISKFIRRHSLGVAASILAIFGLVTAFGISTYQYQRAETARYEAEKRFNDIRSLATTLMTDIHDSIYRIPGSTDATKLVIETSQKYLDDLASIKNAPEDIKRDAGIGYRKLGKAVAGTKSGSINDPELADSYFENSRKILVSLDETQAPDIKTLSALGVLYYNMAEVSILPRRKIDVAETQLQTSLNYLQRAIDLDPSYLPAQLSFLSSYCYRSEILVERDKANKAQDLLQDCIKQADTLHKKFPENLAAMRTKASSGRNLANSLAKEGKYNQAEKVLDSAIKDAELAATLTDEETDGYVMRDQTIGYWRRAYARVQLSKYEAALSDYAQALKFTDKRLELDPNDKDAIWFYHTIIAERASPYQALGRHEEGETDMLKTLKWYEKRHDEKPDSSDRLANLFLHQAMMGDFYLKIPNQIKACSSFKASHIYYKKMQAEGSASARDVQSFEEIKKLAAECNFDF